MPDPDRVTEALRDLIETVRTADLSTVDPAELAEIEGVLTGLTRRLAPHTVAALRTQAALVPSQRRWSPDDIEIGSFFPYSPVSGTRNPVAPPLRLWREGDRVRGEVTVRSTYNGPPDGVHGGYVAALLDELLGATCVALGKGGFTGTLTVRYHSLTPLETPLALEGWIAGEERRKVFARGELRAGERLCAAAEGIFIRSDFDAGWT